MLQCPTCHQMLYAPPNADKFRCPCVQILQNPNVKTSQTTTNFLKQKNDKKDLANVGLGLG